MVAKYLFDTQLTKKIRLIGFILVLCFSLIVFNLIYLDEEIYNSIENIDLINRWSQTQSFISKGFIYPFIYSYANLFDYPPQNYQEETAKTILASYENDDIPVNKQVDIIGIMLEGFNDFSKFNEVEFVVDIYGSWHQLQEESHYGELVNNIFAGETVDTEWGFLTGYTDYHDFRSMTNSYVHYFASQGYKVEAQLLAIFSNIS